MGFLRIINAQTNMNMENDVDIWINKKLIVVKLEQYHISDYFNVNGNCLIQIMTHASGEEIRWLTFNFVDNMNYSLFIYGYESYHDVFIRPENNIPIDHHSNIQFLNLLPQKTVDIDIFNLDNTNKYQIIIYDSYNDHILYNRTLTLPSIEHVLLLLIGNLDSCKIMKIID